MFNLNLLECINKKMKQPTAPPLYPELPTEDGQNYRLQKISEIEQTLIRERDVRKSLYKKYKRGLNITDGVDTALISTSVIMAGIGLAVPVLLPLEIAAIVCGTLGVSVKFVRRKLHLKVEKHDQIRTMAVSKLNSISDLVSKALQDGQISEVEFKTILNELEKYNSLKQGFKKNSRSDRRRESKTYSIRESGGNEGTAEKHTKCLIFLCNRFVFNDPPPMYYE